FRFLIINFFLLLGINAQSAAQSSAYPERIKKSFDEKLKSNNAASLTQFLKEIKNESIEANPDSIEQLLAEFKTKYRPQQNPAAHALWLRLYAKVHSRKNQYQKSYEYHQKALSQFKKTADIPGQVISLNSIGMQCVNLSLYGEAYDYYFRGLLLAERIGDSIGVSLISENIGNLYTYMEEYSKAENFFKRSLEIEKKNQDPSGYFSVKNNLAAIYFHQKKFDLALKAYEDCMQYYSTQTNPEMHMLSLNNTAGTLVALKKFSEARLLVEKSLSLIDTNYQKANLSSAYRTLGEVYYNQKNYRQAIGYSMKALHYFSGSEDKEEAGILYQLLANSYECLGDFRQAYHFLEKYRSNLIVNMNTRSRKDLLQKDIQLEFDRKQIEDSLKLASANRLKDAQLSQQNAELKLKKNQQLYMLITVLLLSSALAVIYKRLKVNQKQKRIIGMQKTKVEEQKREILSSIEYARRIQQAILPSEQFMHHHLPEYFLIYQPKDIVAGDFYWMQLIDETIYLAVCDCTGHGVPGAMVSVVCHNALNRALNEFEEREPGKILDKTRDLVVGNFAGSDENVQDGMDASILCFVPGENKVIWSGANHTLWIYRNEKKTIYAVKPDKQAVGKTDNPIPFTTKEIDIGHGDILYLTTDGYADQFGGENGRKLTRKRFKEYLTGIAGLPMKEQQNLLTAYHFEYKGQEEQVDDICVMGIRF
ncbi:MAG: hypothetical protein RLZZ46_800, partial [Bacteroidota bacterium]